MWVLFAFIRARKHEAHLVFAKASVPVFRVRAVFGLGFAKNKRTVHLNHVYFELCSLLKSDAQHVVDHSDLRHVHSFVGKHTCDASLSALVGGEVAAFIALTLLV